MDVAIDPLRCNLASPDMIRRWIDLAREGRVVAILGGPPCETWSAARGAGAERQGQQRPRPLRSPEALWGLPDLSASERQQVDLGNALLRTQLLFLFLARTYGFVALMEHPAKAWWAPAAPSSWSLPEVQHLLTWGDVVLHTVDQCTLGAKSRKPTGLLAVNLPQLARRLADAAGGGRCLPALLHQHIPLCGRAPDGSWMTAQAKVYPAGMCQLLADSVLDWVEPKLLALQDAEVEEEADLCGLCVPVDWYDPAKWALYRHDCAAALLPPAG